MAGRHLSTAEQQSQRHRGAVGRVYPASNTQYLHERLPGIRRLKAAVQRYPTVSPLPRPHTPRVVPDTEGGPPDQTEHSRSPVRQCCLRPPGRTRCPDCKPARHPLDVQMSLPRKCKPPLLLVGPEESTAPGTEHVLSSIPRVVAQGHRRSTGRSFAPTPRDTWRPGLRLARTDRRGALTQGMPSRALRYGVSTRDAGRAERHDQRHCQ